MKYIFLVVLFCISVVKSVFLQTHFPNALGEEVDVLHFRDVNDTVLSQLATTVFNFEHGSVMSEEPKYPIFGSIYGTEGRILFPFIFQVKKSVMKPNGKMSKPTKSIKALVLFDTRYPDVYLAPHTLKNLGVSDPVNNDMNIFVNGEVTNVKPALDPLYNEINLVGMSYLIKNGLVLTVNGKGLTAKLDRADPNAPIEDPDDTLEEL
jgi:hypothetical protein